MSTQFVCFSTCIRLSLKLEHFVCEWVSSSLYNQGNILMRQNHVQNIFVRDIQTSLTLSPPNKLSSAKFLVCFNIQNASNWINIAQSWLKCCLSVKQLGTGWDGELLAISPESKPFAYGTIFVLSGLRVNPFRSGYGHISTFENIANRLKQRSVPTYNGSDHGSSLFATTT